MTPEELVVERLLDISAVTALVGTRVRLLKLRQRETMPAVRVQMISEMTEYHLRGGSVKGRARIQVDVYAAEASGGDANAAALAVAAAIHGDGNGENASGLSGWIGNAGGSPPTMRIAGVFFLDRAVGYDAEELREVRVRQDYMVHWRRIT